MTFIRPAARDALWQWREVLAAIALVALGVFWLLRSQGLLFWVGGSVVMVGLGLLWVAVPRARFHSDGGGPGVVQIVEGQISYFGPLTGGVLDLDQLSSVVWDATGHPAHWELRANGVDPLYIPSTATGVDGLFEAFQTLPGLSVARLMTVRRETDGRHVVWRKAS